MTGPTRKTRTEVAARDEGCCVACGRQVVDPESLAPWSNWSLQHRVARGMGGSRTAWINTPVNLVTVCGDGTSGCHGEIESRREWARNCGYAVPQWADPVEVPVLHWTHGWSWIRPSGWVPLTVPELRLQAAQWLADAERAPGADPIRLSRQATAMFGLTEEAA